MSNLNELFFWGIQGTSLTEEEKLFLKNNSCGGIILFSKNYESPKQIKNLISEIKKLSPKTIISIDHEGGLVFRFKKDFYHPPPLREMKGCSKEEVYKTYSQVAQELQAVGVNLNFFPCIDLSSKSLKDDGIGSRSFSSQPEDVIEILGTLIKSHQDHNVLTCVKHFPGHGEACGDSHELLPLQKKKLSFLKENEWKVFKEAVNQNVDMIMVGHLLVPEIDEKKPSSLSPQIYEFLRREVGWGSLIITDDLEMGALDFFGNHEERALNILECGADFLLYRKFSTMQHVYQSVKKEYNKSVIFKNLCDQRIKRVRDYKESKLCI